jgi:hypothetical protein
VQVVLEGSQDNAGAITTDGTGLKWIEFSNVQPPTVWAYVSVTDVPPAGLQPKKRTILILSMVRGTNNAPVLY